MTNKGNKLAKLKDKRLLLLIAIIIAFWLASFRIPVSDLFLLIRFGIKGTTPIALAAVGEVLNERGGLFNIGLEGIMLLGAFLSVFMAELTGSWLIGTLSGIILGAFISLIFSIIATYGKGNQLITGIGINIFAGGFAAFYIWKIWQPGHHMLSSEKLMIPGISTPIGSISWIFFIAIGMGILIYFVLHKTRFGMRVRAAGNNPFVADVSGIDVYKIRVKACVIGGALAGLAGAYISLGWLGMVTDGMPAGRGFIALATVVFSGLNPLTALAGAGIFGFFDGLSDWLLSVSWAKPLMMHGGNYFFHALPYLIVLIVLAVFIGKRRFPKAIGKPYLREK